LAQIFPSIENIERLKVSPTDGEIFLLHHLIDSMDDDVEIFFQPFLNGDRPDIILIKKDSGVAIIEVKDWNLKAYKIGENNKWYASKNNQRIKSPFDQAFGYKHNLFNLHINGLLEKKLKNKNFYKLIKVFVYFHGQSKLELARIFSQPIDVIDVDLESNNKYFSDLSSVDKKGRYEGYEKRRNYLQNKKDKLEKDKNTYAITEENIKKISLPTQSENSLFDIGIYYEFKRYLQPPYHTLEEGKEIVYEKKQAQFSESTNTHQKIKGVAGAGKTVVLAKRAVNAHKRHGEIVLVLTYNLTLKSYIHDRISDVREGFSWNSFYITNYHQLISQTLNELNIEIEIPENTPKHLVSEYLDQKYYSNIDVFKSKEDEIHKFNSILIDEIQDYKPEWIKIIRSYFLEPDSEMVLFGDEKQNIYERDIDEEKNTKIVQGFGRWQKLNKSFRHKENSHILKLAKSFQQHFFKERYDIDQYEENPIQKGLLGLGLNKVTTYSNDNLGDLVSTIFKNIKGENIHPNDATILCSKISTMREIDYIVRNKFNEKTLTTFETKERFESPYSKEIDNIRKIKKIGFNLNSGLLKLSTIHSFKGYESPTVFLIIDENDHDEMIYVGITRAKINIMVFLLQESKYKDFFAAALENEL